MHKKLRKIASDRASPRKEKRSCRKQRKQCQLSVGCWNMRTLVESEGPIETSVARPNSRGVTVDRKASLMVQELKKYGVSVTGISETKWFGQAVYQVEGYTILHSGRSVPVESPLHRNEGVGIVLDPALAAAWKAAGEDWSAVSSRVVRARFKMGREQVDGARTPTYITVVSVYAPTFRAPVEEKEKFYSDLQDTLDGVSEQDLLLIVGDLNARVGSTEWGGSSVSWPGVRGVHGAGKVNEAGAELLSFCALNELTIMNTHFKKNNIHKFTWQHPGSKQWHCIDYIIVRQKQRRLCRDVGVVRCADCWTDHKLLCARISIKVPRKPSASKIISRFAVYSLKDSKVREKYSNVALKEVSHDWNQEASGERKWKAIKVGMCMAAEAVLGQEMRRQPDWFEDNIHNLKALITKQNDLFLRWLSTRCPTDRQRYVMMRREVAHKIRCCKNAWFQEKAGEVKVAVRRGKGA